MKEKVMTLEVGKCYQMNCDNNVFHIIRVNEVHKSSLPNRAPNYKVAEVWGNNTIKTNSYYTVREGDVYTEISQEYFISVLNSMLLNVSNYISKISN